MSNAWRDQTGGLTGLRILVVEDEAILAMLLEDMLEDLGCSLVGMASGVEDAMAAIGAHELDGVLLDMNLHGRRTVPIAEELARRSVPFLLVTGYGGGDGDAPVIKAAPRLQKPFTEQDLARRMEAAFVALPKND